MWKGNTWVRVLIFGQKNSLYIPGFSSYMRFYWPDDILYSYILLPPLLLSKFFLSFVSIRVLIGFNRTKPTGFNRFTYYLYMNISTLAEFKSVKISFSITTRTTIDGTNKIVLLTLTLHRRRRKNRNYSCSTSKFSIFGGTYFYQKRTEWWIS